MPGNSWRDKLGKNIPSAAAPITNFMAPPVSPNKPASTNNRLNELLQQRQSLEQRMQRLTGGGEQNGRESARFSVPSFAQRQAEQRQWEMIRERQGLKQPSTTPVTNNPKMVPLSRTGQNNSARTGLRDFTQPVSEWLNARDAQRQQVRENARVLDKATTAVQKLRGMGQDLNNLDQRLASEGLTEERDQLKQLGIDKIKSGNSILKSAENVLSAPTKAADKLGSAWQSRRDHIGGAMDKMGSYVERSKQRLSAETGGSGDLFERMKMNREKSLLQRQFQQKQEKRDQARRDRAQQKRKDKEATE
jgi:hypothetical protein